MFFMAGGIGDFLSLIFISTCIDYTIGLKLSGTKKERNRKKLLWCSIGLNLGLLGVFKYYNFFIENFVEVFTLFGIAFDPYRLNIILPVGISFYTFQTLSYTLDSYYGKIKPTKDFIAFAVFVSFFPQLVAGPIERAKNLLPQFHQKRIFVKEQFAHGLKQILWGLFKKIVIADTCAVYVNLVFNNYTDYSGGILYIGACMFAIQIYGDFSGYSDIAIGTARLFGFKLKQNFATPYFSRDIAEFWRRWHISLTTWFRDYVYIPLGGSKVGQAKKIRNTFIIFLVSGFWHGANWTFLVWGLLNALFFLPLLLRKKNRKNLNIVGNDSFLPKVSEVFKITLTFNLTVLAWIVFRSNDIKQAYAYITIMLGDFYYSNSFIEAYYWLLYMAIDNINPLYYIVLMFVFEYLNRKNTYGLQFDKVSKLILWPIYLAIIILIWKSSGSQEEFIYFQF